TGLGPVGRRFESYLADHIQRKPRLQRGFFVSAVSVFSCPAFLPAAIPQLIFVSFVLMLMWCSGRQKHTRFP
ncbi:hypothetical protein, partial [Morganella morganii]